MRAAGSILGLVCTALLIAGGTEAAERLRLATTTSTENSGLLDVLNPPFEERFGIRVDVIAVGTGKALALGRNGDADVLLVHAPEAEKEFIAAGAGVNRRFVMYNDFVVLGPAGDPAGVRASAKATEALAAIAATGHPFVSRGDDSGTHRKERSLWEGAGVQPEGTWYLAVGQGMGAALMIAEEKQAYILADRGTRLAYRDKLSLEVLFEGDDGLFNPYGVIAVNPARAPYVQYLWAMAYIGWLTSPEGQKIIREFTVGGEALFRPLVVPQPARRRGVSGIDKVILR